MEPVGVGRRAVAAIIDGIVLLIVGFALAFATGGADPGMGLNLLYFIFCVAYFVVMEKTSGATLGKKAMGLRVVKKDGEPLDWMASVIRNLLRIIDGIALYLVGAIVIWISKDKQRIGDMAANTIVVREGT